jgi:hypothetical protein
MLLNQMAVMVFYMFAMGILNFKTRFKAIKGGTLKVGHFRTYDTSKYQVPENVIVMGRHYDNQFQLPILFLITCVAAQTMPLYSPTYLGPLAWVFILTRVVHSFIHLGSNNVRVRALSFAAGWLCVLAMWILMALTAYV